MPALHHSRQADDFRDRFEATGGARPVHPRTLQSRRGLGEGFRNHLFFIYFDHLSPSATGTVGFNIHMHLDKQQNLT